jgi:hypothetical protein
MAFKVKPGTSPVTIVFDPVDGAGNPAEMPAGMVFAAPLTASKGNPGTFVVDPTGLAQGVWTSGDADSVGALAITGTDPNDPGGTLRGSVQLQVGLNPATALDPEPADPSQVEIVPDV